MVVAMFMDVVVEDEMVERAMFITHMNWPACM